MKDKKPDNICYTKKLSVFFVCTNKEFQERDLELCAIQFLNKNPTKKYKFDLIFCFNKVLEQDSLDCFVEMLERFPCINQVKIVSLDIDESQDVFWYPWLNLVKPVIKPALGYTSGANKLFYDSLRILRDDQTNYENFLMLESDTFACKEGWFDCAIDFIKSNDFTIAGSTYKGSQLCHYTSHYKDHLNGVAIYKNCDKLFELIGLSESYIKERLPEEGYLNFDIANYIVSKKRKDFKLVDTDFIINCSDPRDADMTEKEVFKQYSNAHIIHQKKKRPLKLISPEFATTGFKKKMPTFFCTPKGATEYTLNVIGEMVSQKAEAKKKRFKKIITRTPSNSSIILFCLVDDFFARYNNSYFIYNQPEECQVPFYNLLKMISEKSIAIESMAIDLRYSNDFDQLAFSQFRKIIELVEIQPILFSFLKHPLDNHCSDFPQYIQSQNLDGLTDGQKNAKLVNFLAHERRHNFFVKSFVGINKSYDIDFAQNHTLNCLEKFNIFQDSVIDQVLNFLFIKYHNINLGSLEAKSININHTHNKISLHPDLINETVLSKIQKKLNFEYYIYENYAKSEIGRYSVPLLFGVPGCGHENITESFRSYFSSNYFHEKSDSFYEFHLKSNKNKVMIFFTKVNDIHELMLHESKNVEKKGNLIKCPQNLFSDLIDKYSISIFAGTILPHAYNMYKNYIFASSLLNKFLFDVLPLVSFCKSDDIDQKIKNSHDDWLSQSLGFKDEKKSKKLTESFFIKNNFRCIRKSEYQDQLKEVLEDIHGINFKPSNKNIIKKKPIKDSQLDNSKFDNMVDYLLN